MRPHHRQNRLTSRKGGQRLALHDALRRGGERQRPMRDAARALCGCGGKTIVRRIRTSECNARVAHRACPGDILIVIGRARGGGCDAVARDDT